MNMRDLIPWGRNNNQAPNIYGGGDPFVSLHREVNRLFDDMLKSFETRLPSMGQLSSFDNGWPKLEISESDNELRVTAEVPGMEEKDIEVLLDEDVLTLRGEKRSETEEKGYSERFYGRFERRIPLGYEVEDDKVKASFANGVLTLTLPKNPDAQSKVKRIPITH
ncbi:Hsp20/alpha crystallin family protein [Mesorhizobium sp. B283B1A]|uniref:Hsp20/alpha crystallin family protein n=1 Tax=Mesorhizobium TaxID=68287 RepID=UPI001CD0C269|nr:MULTISPECIES: Hsp20/alpha crystallin family protein [Mesorhizobium]MCA0049076.1 Hsp20/alpha crystallin family protein [Mesorhizobium sp. B283B1A]UQS62708.1 Hsp20/alpha crystallin family protein [Mesorhizobium opportunistum]